MNKIFLTLLLFSMNSFASEHDDRLKCEVSARCVSIRINCDYIGKLSYSNSDHQDHVVETVYTKKDTLSCVLNSGEFIQMEKLHLPERNLDYKNAALHSKEEVMGQCQKNISRLQRIYGECQN